jgi:hypothetical protein
MRYKGMGVKHHAPAALPPGKTRKDSVPIVQEAGWAPGPVWTRAENLVPTRIQSPDRPARSQSLYQLRYQAHKILKYGILLTIPTIQSTNK